MVRRQTIPETLVRHYFDQAEYGGDEAGLLAIGYIAVARDLTPTHGVGASELATTPVTTEGASAGEMHR
jgi:hypothetical protein